MYENQYFLEINFESNLWKGFGSVLVINDFWAADACICGTVMAHEYACTTSRCPLFLIGLGCRFSSLGWYPHSAELIERKV